MLIFFASLAWILFTFAGFRGFPYWYGGFLIFFWVAFGLWNYHDRTSLWLLKSAPKVFLKFYTSLAVFLVLFDIAGQKTNLWTYPIYDSLPEWLWVYLILYPLAASALLELIYFVSGVFTEKLIFMKKPFNSMHQMVDRLEILLFYSMIAALLAIIFNFPLSTLWTFVIYTCWIIVATIKLRFHINPCNRNGEEMLLPESAIPILLLH